MDIQDETGNSVEDKDEEDEDQNWARRWECWGVLFCFFCFIIMSGLVQDGVLLFFVSAGLCSLSFFCFLTVIMARETGMEANLQSQETREYGGGHDVEVCKLVFDRKARIARHWGSLNERGVMWYA
jgi:hypothetical protein